MKKLPTVGVGGGTTPTPPPPPPHWSLRSLTNIGPPNVLAHYATSCPQLNNYAKHVKSPGVGGGGGYFHYRRW